MPEPHTRELVIKALARRQGFELAGIASALPTLESLFYPKWIEHGYAARMDYLKGRRAGMRSDPRSLLPEAKSIIAAGLLYNAPDCPSPEAKLSHQGRISQYAWGEDYHDVLRRRLYRLAGAMQERFGAFRFKVCVDTAPLLERAYARHAGLGWIGKNTCLINQALGSWFFLGEILTSLELEPDQPPPFRCGTCTRCIDACPTGALVPLEKMPADKTGGPEYALDSAKCISYTTIELRGPIPQQDRDGIGAHVFGCDICQDVCPWNHQAATATAEEFQSPSPPPELGELASLSEEEFNERFARTAIERTRYRGLLRNAAVAMGNSRERRYLGMLEALAASEDDIVSEHARWAIEKIRAAASAPIPEVQAP